MSKSDSLPESISHHFRLMSYSDEECGGGSVVVSYGASVTDIPTKEGDQVAAIECLYFQK